MNKDIWGAVGLIGDDLISAASESHVKEYFKHKKKQLWLKYASIAACFVFVIVAAVAVPSIINNFIITNAESEEVDLSAETHSEYPIISMHSSADWPWYSTVGEIVDASTEIYSGKITGISFEIVDLTTGKADRSPDIESAHRMLYTLYTVAVTDSYKGETVSEKVICITGGMAGYNEKEQYDLLESSGLLNKYHGIPVTEKIRSLKIGSEYLFCTARTAGDYDHIINPDQFAYQLDSENAKKIIHFVK